MARAGGARQHQVAVRLTLAEAVAMDACRVLDGETGRPVPVPQWLMARVRERLEKHADASMAADALAALEVDRRLHGAPVDGAKPPAVCTADPRTLLQALRDLADRRGDQEALAMARAALGEVAPQERMPAVGDVFEHRDYQWSNGDPRRCVVLEVGDGDVTFACLDRTDRRPVKARHRVDLETFEAAHLGRRLDP